MPSWIWSRWKLRHHRELAPDARDGDRVRVTGIVRAADDTLIAPLSGRPCIGFHATARAYGGKADPRIPPVVTTARLRPFVVETGRERVLVVAEHAQLQLARVDLAGCEDRELQFLARHAIAQRTARFVEILLADGMRATVAGTLVLVPSEAPPAGERGFRDPPPLEPRIVGSHDTPLVIVAA